MIGQWLGANAGDRLTALVLANTSPVLADPAPIEQRRQTVIRDGMSAVVDAVMERFFTPESRAGGLPVVASTRRTILATNPTGYAGCCAAVRDMDNRALLPAIRVPTLVIGGDRDMSTPWDGNGSVLAASIAGAQSVRFPTAHLSNLECPSEFSAALREFLKQG